MAYSVKPKKEGTRRIKALLLFGSPVARKIITAIKPYPVPHHAGSVRLPKKSACLDKGGRIFVFRHIAGLTSAARRHKKQIITVIKQFYQLSTVLALAYILSFIYHAGATRALRITGTGICASLIRNIRLSGVLFRIRAACALYLTVYAALPFIIALFARV